MWLDYPFPVTLRSRMMEPQVLKRFSKFGLLIWIVTVSGCQYSATVDHITTIRPTPPELQGVYYFDELVSTDPERIDRKRLPDAIMLNGDLTFKLVFSREGGNEAAGETPRIFTGTTGTFRIAETDAGSRVGWGLVLAPPLTLDNELLCFDEGPGHRLAIEFGDSDAGEYAVYTRSEGP